MNMSEPWPMEKRIAVNRKIDKEAARAASRLGAKTVILVACFEDSDGYISMLDGSTAPFQEMAQLYQKLAKAYMIQKETGDAGDVEVVVPKGQRWWD